MQDSEDTVHVVIFITQVAQAEKMCFLDVTIYKLQPSIKSC